MWEKLSLHQTIRGPAPDTGSASVIRMASSVKSAISVISFDRYILGCPYSRKCQSDSLTALTDSTRKVLTTIPLKKISMEKYKVVSHFLDVGGVKYT